MRLPPWLSKLVTMCLEPWMDWLCKVLRSLMQVRHPQEETLLDRCTSGVASVQAS